MRIKVSLSRRLQQLFCSHKDRVGWGCSSKGINKFEGYWFMDFYCDKCGFSYGKWVHKDREMTERYLNQDKVKIK